MKACRGVEWALGLKSILPVNLKKSSTWCLTLVFWRDPRYVGPLLYGVKNLEMFSLVLVAISILLVATYLGLMLWYTLRSYLLINTSFLQS